MILIDKREGSRDLLPLLIQRQIPCELTFMDFGDAALCGNGPGGPVTVGVERKRIRDLANSLLGGRLQGHQLPGIVGQYDHAWIVIEGSYRAAVDGLIEIPRGKGQWTRMEPRLLSRGLESWLLTLEMRGGVRLKWTHSAQETADWLGTLWRWWTQKQWADHRAHLALGPSADTSIFQKPSLVRRWAAELPGVGYEKSQAVDQHFESPVQMAGAGVGEWRKIPGIGVTLADRIVATLRAVK